MAVTTKYNRTKPKPNEFQLIRVYDAPVAVVWDAWTDVNKVAKWWGPRGFTITTHSKDLKVGGHWKYTMHGPDGTDYPNYTVYHEVEERKLLVYDHGGTETTPPLFRVTAIFRDRGDQTELDFTMACDSEAARIEIQKFIKAASGNSTWDRLGEFLVKEVAHKDIFLINRSFEAPMETVYEMWVNPKHVAKWLGPIGSSLEYIEEAIAEGKTSFYKMTHPDGPTMYGKISYKKINRPGYLEYSQWFCDEKGERAKHPMAPLWPDVMNTRVFFTEESENQTRVTLIWEPEGKVPAAELSAFLEMRPGITQGWTGSFDRLEDVLSDAKG